MELETKLIDMDLSVRALNCLNAAEIYTLRELVSIERKQLLKYRNIGYKTINELDNLLEKNGLNFK